MGAHLWVVSTLYGTGGALLGDIRRIHVGSGGLQKAIERQGDVQRVRERFADVESRVAAAAKAAGRDPAGTRVLVATKYVAAEHLGALAEAGVRLIGENRAQDLVAKHELYGDAFEYHFIGHLQSRKTRLILPIATLISGIDSLAWLKINAGTI